MPLPDGLMMMVPTKILPLLTTRCSASPPKSAWAWNSCAPPKCTAGDESVADFVREHYGQEAVDYLAEPLLSGIYGGDPARTQRDSRAARASSNSPKDTAASPAACWPRAR